MKIELPSDHPGHKDRVCKSCGEFKQASEFSVYKHAMCYGGYQALNSCKVCDSDRKLRQHLMSKYNMTLEDYEQMVLDQDNKCYLCNEEPSDVFGKLVVDHDHTTGKVRSLLCRTCNLYLSRIEKCPDYLARVVTYLST